MGVQGKMHDLLALIAAEPFRGVIDSSDGYGPHPLDPYVDDRGDQNTDTFNLAHDFGYLRTGHDSDSDASTTWLTEAGRAALAHPSHQAASAAASNKTSSTKEVD